MSKVVRMKQKVRPLKSVYYPDAPYAVERHDENDGTIYYAVQDMRPESFREVCSISDSWGGNPRAKHDAEQVARGLNLLVQYGLETLPNVRREED